MKTKTVVMNDRVSGNVGHVDNLVVYGGVIGNIEKCENVYIIGGDILGNVNSNGMVFGCDKLPPIDNLPIMGNLPIIGNPIKLAY